MDFVLPAAWRRSWFPRRGSSGVTRFVPDPQAREVFTTEMGRLPHRVRAVLTAPTTAESTTAEALAWLEGRPGATPLGASAVAAATIAGNGYNRDQMTVVADLLIAEHGVRFAAEAAVILNALLVIDDNPPHRGGTGGKQRPGVRHLRPGETRHGWQPEVLLLILLRVRRALADLSDADHDGIVTALTPFRAAHPYARVATSVLVPSRHDWVEQDVAAAVADTDANRAAALLTAAGTAEQLDALAPVANRWLVVGSMPMLTTLVDGVGPAAASALFHWVDERAGDADAQKRLLSVLAELPGEVILPGLIKRIEIKFVPVALLEAAERHPGVALRLFAEGAAKRPVADLLRGHVLAHLDLVESVLPELSPGAAELVERIVAQSASLVVAPVAALPPLLVDPPWQHRTEPLKPIVVTGLSCDDAGSVRWQPGEREAWAQTPLVRFPDGKHSWESTAKRLLAGRGEGHEAARFFTRAPEEIARPVLVKWRPRRAWEAGSWLRVAAARFGADALPAVLHLAGRNANEAADLLLPFASPEIAVLAADWLARLKSLRRAALSWLLRHPAEAAHALIPPALAKPGAARRQAEAALLALHAHGHTTAVRAAAHRYGPETGAAIETLLTTDPLAVLPARMPPVPVWANPALLPPVRLSDGSGALPPESVRHLVTVLSLSRLDDPYAGLAVVRRACDPGSLAEFAWGVFHRWQLTGASAKENWALDALGLLGDDETVRRLTPLILAWPGDGGHAKAVTGVNILATIGTDVALMHLHRISQRAKFKGLSTAAHTTMAEVAAGLGLTPEQLADRLVPDFGLSADGSLRLDYGTRQFVVGFDEQLRPFVADATGKRLKALPKPGARDDATLAPAAWKQFAALKKDVRTVATDQVRRLEHAMVRGRRWSVPDFRRFFVDHPLVWHVSRRLLWAAYDATGPARPFRIAEDRSWSAVDDEQTTLAPDATVGVAHPLHLGDSLADWAAVFADYEILQPFPQLSRPVLALTPEEAADSRLARFEGITLPTTKVLGLERRGWRREQPQDAGMQSRMELTLTPGLEFAVELDPGIAVGAVEYFEEQKITDAYLHDGTGSRWGAKEKGRVPLSSLNAVAASELLRDLTDLAA